MNPAPPARPAAPRLATDLAKTLNLSDAGKALLNATLTVRQYFDALVGAGHHQDAIRFLAAALPKRESVWWGVACAREVLKALPEPQAKALAAAERWVKDPTEGNRRSAGAAAEAAGYGNPPGSLAAGAFWSGGSLAPANLPAVLPRDDLTGVAVGAALVLASVADPEKAAAARKRFLALGADVAAGKSKW
ncbi:MAG TPA: hypothetical protein VKE74_20605 [Gemmataceae bacterium]|nr:hypothetical protein [Gemmataceae bacterium]